MNTGGILNKPEQLKEAEALGRALSSQGLLFPAIFTQRRNL